MLKHKLIFPLFLVARSKSYIYEVSYLYYKKVTFWDTCPALQTIWNCLMLNATTNMDLSILQLNKKIILQNQQNSFFPKNFELVLFACLAVLTRWENILRHKSISTNLNVFWLLLPFGNGIYYNSFKET